MSRKPLKRFLAFFGVLIVTVAVVAVLSCVDRADGAEEYMRQLHSQSQSAPILSAPVVGEQGIPVLISLVGFLSLLIIAAIWGLWFLRARRRAQENRARQSRRPKREPALHRPVSTNHRV